MLVLQHRHCQTDAACKREKWREMDNATYALHRSALVSALEPRETAEFSSSNATQRAAWHLREEIAVYARADVLVGLHGAGLTNVMFMRPGELASL